MKEKIINIFNKIRQSKRAMYLVCSGVLILFCFALNVTFSLFTNSNANNAANIKVKNMEYTMAINGVAGTVITAPTGVITRSNVSITALNKYDSKYELYYHVCATEACETYIEKPDGLLVEYSSRTVDSVNGEITTTGNKNVRIIVHNTTGTTYYIKMDVNAGYAYNTLTLKNLITVMHDEDDLTVYAYINGTESQDFPTTYNYATSVTCNINGGTSNATPLVSWNGTKWTMSVSNMDTGENVCKVYFNLTNISNLKNAILLSAGGESAIIAKGTPSFSSTSTTNAGMYSSADDYGTSYYYRGVVNNNWVYYAGIYWRIIRINGDGTIRLIYSGTTAPTSSSASVMTGTNTQLSSTSSYNTSGNAYYVGFKYTAGVANGNSTSSVILSALDTWYTNNISGDDINFIANEIFCNDRSLTSGTGINQTFNSPSIYYPYTRLYTNKSPSLLCSSSTDKFTAIGGTAGNQALSNPVGLITADEISMAGGVYNTSNTYFYLYTGQNYWTMSPYNGTGTLLGTIKNSRVFSLSTGGNLIEALTSSSYGVRPVINLKSNTDVSGSGTYNDPYVVKGLSS
jgi:hypothetical protein